LPLSRTFVGNIWDEGTKADMGFFVDQRADDSQREAMQAIFSGQTGGWPAMFAAKLGQMLGMEPGAVATYGTVTVDEVEAFGFKWNRTGRSSKHMAFVWSGPD
jgi:hypothetical protein